jgi:arginine exporter protein ArgO
MSAAFLAGVAAGYGIAVPVGAIGVLIAGLSARTSLRVGAAAGLGAATRTASTHWWPCSAGRLSPASSRRSPRPALDRGRRLAAGGGEHRVPGVPPAQHVADSREPVTARAAYAGILGLTLLNPATVIYFAALILGRGGAGGGVWFVVGAFLASASWQLLLAGGARWWADCSPASAAADHRPGVQRRDRRLGDHAPLNTPLAPRSWSCGWHKKPEHTAVKATNNSKIAGSSETGS